MGLALRTSWRFWATIPARRTTACPQLGRQRVTRCCNRHLTGVGANEKPKLLEIPVSQCGHDHESPIGPSARSTLPPVPKPARPRARRLPVTCPGCGALSQESNGNEAGYYTRTRKTVKEYLTASERDVESSVDDHEAHTATASNTDTGVEVESAAAGWDRLGDGEVVLPSPARPPPPMCDRCHHLIHDSRGSSIAHPSIQDIADSIGESSFSRNHVYHVLDAADFPMSLIPSIHKHLSLAKPRTQNRRSQHSFSSKPSLSFIVTRSDLLGPTKEIVDRMMPKLAATLRSALGRVGRNMRLGNVHLVSAKRGWWTTSLKDDIWDRGGGNWLVGKFNVGKSSLVEVLFPKGSHARAAIYADEHPQPASEGQRDVQDDAFLNVAGLLPPSQPEVPFPVMPLVSTLPGTTASPIRLPFGNRKGELIDMPGLPRSPLDRFVRPQDRADLVMTHRASVSQHNVKQGQSLLLGGGLVRITPKLRMDDPSTILMAYPFVPLKAHVTSTSKAIEMQSQRWEGGVDSVLADDGHSVIASAGTFHLKTNVTKSRAGSLLRAGVDAARLPFVVFATDILIEGIGWVELVCQVRKTALHRPAVVDSPADMATASAASNTDARTLGSSEFVPLTSSTHDGPVAPSAYPEVEIFTPMGASIGQRESLDVWQAWATGKGTKRLRAARPRRPMSGVDKREKARRRAAIAT